jgi:hypothetical protein
LAEGLNRRWWHRARHHPVARHSGIVLKHCSQAAHWLMLAVMGVSVVTTAVVAFVAWQLSQKPIDSLWLANRLNAALTESAAPVRVVFGAVSLSWAGFRAGVDVPVDMRVSDLRLSDQAGHTIATADEAQLGFSVTDLIRGEIFPRSVEVQHAFMILTRESANLIAPAGQPTPIDVGQSPTALDIAGTQLIPAPLRRLHFRDTDIVFRDPAAKLDLHAQHMDLNVRRQGNGHVQGVLIAPLQIGTARTEIRASLDLVPNGQSSAELRVEPLRPAAMADSEAFGFLKPLDVPVALTARAELDRHWYPASIEVGLRFGPGQILLGQGSTPVLGGFARLSGSPSRMTLSDLHLDLMQAADGGTETADLTGTIIHASDRLTAEMTLTANHVEAGDLPVLWPLGVAGGARPWVVEHILGGLAKGSANFTLEADERLRDVVLTKATGDLDVSNGAFTWIDRVPPIEQAQAHLHMADPDTLLITVSSARQRIGKGKPDLLVSDGWMRIVGMSVKDQYADLHVGVKGPVTSAMALLSEPRLQLLATHPIALKPAAGDVAGTLTFQFPLENRLTIDEVSIKADTHLTGLRLADVIGHNALEQGAIDMTVDRDGLTLKGGAQLASIPITLSGSMDFRDGPSDQVVETVAMAGEASAADLDAAGLKVGDVLAGSVGLVATLTERRGGAGSLAVTGDLSKATLTVGALDFRQKMGPNGRASANLQLRNDKMTGIDHIAVSGEGVALAGSASLPANAPSQFVLDRIELGKTAGHGSVRIAPDGATAITLQGPSIDLSAKLTETGSHGGEQPSTPPWTLDARFDRAILAHEEAAQGLTVAIAGGGEKAGLVDFAGSMETGGPTDGAFRVSVAASGGKRVVSVQAADAGRFLRGLDVINGLNGGKLSVNGELPAGLGLAPMTGTASLEGVVVRNSPVLGKLLQAITLYGLVDALRGPGMMFGRIAATFRYDGRDVFVDNGVAQNSSLGVTAQGRVAMGAGSSEVQGTIVPAYFFNALPGKLPLIGKLFSPEQGGGLFAWRYSVTGPIGNPSVGINPVSAFTPGFLRGLFGLFDHQTPAAPPGDYGAAREAAQQSSRP